MSAAFVIAFREGLEAFLILGIVLSILDKAQLNSDKKFAWFGLFLGFVASLIMTFVFMVLIDGFEKEDIQYQVSLVILLFAIIMLTSMLFWIENNDIRKNIENKIILSTNQKLVIISLIFFAILREGFELVVFLFALSSNLDFDSNQASYGTLLGLSSSALLIYVAFVYTKVINIKKVFQYSSIAIMLITAGLCSLLIRGLQAKDYMSSYIDPLYDISHIMSNNSIVGQFAAALVGYDATPSLLQVLVFVLYIIIVSYITKLKKVKK